MFEVSRESDTVILLVLHRTILAYCQVIEEEADRKPWYHDIKQYLKNKEYPHGASENNKKTLRRMARGFFNIIYRYGIPSRIITDNGTNLNNKMMTELCEQFKINHHNSTPYRPKENGAVEAVDKNIKKIVQKMVRTTIRTSMGDMPYSLVYGMEAVLPIEIEIPSL
ncbi:Pol polyprotein, partial [Mucuna pruriens]